MICGLVYGSIQHVLRMSGNDPQIQIAEDTAQMLNSGEDPKKIIPITKVDIETSLSPFVAIYDSHAVPLATSGFLNDAAPAVPEGVFAYTKVNGENRLTWQPRPGVRQAIVVTPFKNGFVIAGRSLREVEKSEDDLFTQVSIAWISMVGFTLLSFIFSSIFRKGKK